jgi:hypothetical protein
VCVECFNLNKFKLIGKQKTRANSLYGHRVP